MFERGFIGDPAPDQGRLKISHENIQFHPANSPLFCDFGGSFYRELVLY
jgi:hypothetical protein